MSRELKIERILEDERRLRRLEGMENDLSDLRRRVDGCIESLEAVNKVNESIENEKHQQLKLNHQISILTRAMNMESMHNLQQSYKLAYLDILGPLTDAFIQAVKKTYPDVPTNVVNVLPTNNPTFGDFQCSAAMPIVQILKSSGAKASPQIVAKSVLENLQCDFIEKTSVAGPGFMNIYLKRSYVSEQISNLVARGASIPRVKRCQVVVDFSSPNVAKEMHVGHLRSTIIGDSICNLLEYFGHSVLRLNHIGDWGTQFGMLIAHLQDMFPNYLTQSPSVGNLQRFYKESKIRFDTDETFKKRAYECVVQLQRFHDNYTKAWKLICDASRKEFQKVYERLNIRLVERGESFYQTRMKDLVDELDKKCLLEEDEGRKIMWGCKEEDGGEKMIPLTIVKSDGGFTYDTSDMAALKQRIQEEKADWIVYVTDEGQGTHFKVLQMCAQRAGFFNPADVRVDFVGFGVVLGEDKKKFKTRSGDTVRLVELLDEGVKRATEKLKEKGNVDWDEGKLRETSEAIAYGCIKYADLSHNRNHMYVFSFDKMLEDKGNTAVYLLYAYTRIKSISRNACVPLEELKASAPQTAVPLCHEKEWKLALLLVQFHDVLQRITQDLCLHRLCEYLYDVACTFSEFYDNCYCIEKNDEGAVVKKHYDRLILCEATAVVMEKSFAILGIKTITRM